SAAVQRLPHDVRREQEHVRIDSREDERRRAQRAIVRRAAATNTWANLLHVAGATIVAGDLAAVDDVGVERIGRRVAVLLDAGRMPIGVGDASVVATTAHACGTGLLLS